MRSLVESRPTRGAWIEIRALLRGVYSPSCRAPHGARGLKFYLLQSDVGEGFVAPHTGRVD